MDQLLELNDYRALEVQGRPRVELFIIVFFLASDPSQAACVLKRDSELTLWRGLGKSPHLKSEAPGAER